MWFFIPLPANKGTQTVTCERNVSMKSFHLLKDFQPFYPRIITLIELNLKKIQQYDSFLLLKSEVNGLGGLGY